METSHIVLLVLFILYVVLPIRTPEIIAPLIDNIFGIAVLLFAAIYLYVNTGNPVLGIVAFIVVYQLIRRSSLRTGTAHMIKYTPTQAKKDTEMKALNVPQEMTLEEEMARRLTPLASSDENVSQYKPVYAETSFEISDL